MTTFYCDYEGGNDASAGTSFATRWKTLTNGATAARIAPGDTIRMMASPDPTSLGQSAQWTDGPLPATFVPTSSTNTTPIVFTKVGHGLVTGDTIIVNGHLGNTNANGVWDVTVSGDTFTLLNADGSNSIGNGVGGATGTVRKITNSVVKLTTAITKNIANCGNSKIAWTTSANASSSVVTSVFKEGYGIAFVAPLTAFTTGLVAYFPTGTLDLSGYQQVSFWMYQAVGTLGAAGSCSLALCSDTAGTIIVNTINIPALGSLNRWSPITVDLGTNLGSSIQSIAFIVNTDNGAQTFYIDNIIACKASSSADSLNLTSLIGKNAGTEGWYGIQSINGTRVILDMDTNCMPTTTPSRGYSGTTESVTTYKRETIKTLMGALTGTIVQSIQDSGIDGSPITFSGGWNRTDMSTLTGDTCFDGQNGFGYLVSFGVNSYITLNGLSGFRYDTVFSINNSAIVNCSITAKNTNNNTNYGVNSGSGRNEILIIDNSNNNKGYGIYVAHNNLITVINSNNNGGNTGVALGGINNVAAVANSRNNSSYGIDMSGTYSNNNICQLGNSDGNGTASIFQQYGNQYLRNSTLNSILKTSGVVATINCFIWSTNENGNTNTHFGYTDGGLISSDITTIHTAGGMSWKLSPTSTTRSSSYPLPLKVATGAVAANTPITCNVWFYRDNTGLSTRLVCRGGQLTGIDNDIITNMTGAANTWYQLSVTVTPTQKGVLEFYAECWGGTTYNLWTDDVTFS